MSSATGIRVKTIDHVTIVVADMKATRHFYVDQLGMEEVPRPDFSFAGLWFQAGSTQIHIIEAHEESGAAGWGDRGVKQLSRSHHYAFEVDDARAAAEQLRDAGIEIAHGPKLRPDGYVQLYICDPDGHLVELFSPPE